MGARERWAVVRRMGERLRSLRLTVALLCGIAALAVAGTLVQPPPGAAGAPGRLAALVAPGRGPVYPLLAALLVVNVSLCTWHRFRGAVRSPLRLRVVTAWFDAAAHLALVVMLAGGIGKGIWGKVGTGYLFVDTPATSRYLPGKDVDEPLGFSVLLLERRDAHYPLRMKVGVRDGETGAKVALLEVLEGREASLPDGRLRLSVQGVRQDPAAVDLAVRTAAGSAAVTLPLVPGGDPVPAGPFRLTAVAWRRDIKDVRGRVRILEGQRVVREGWLEVNGGLSHRGTSLFLTAWGADEFGNRFLGVQYRDDPAAPLFWAGAVLLALALPPFVALRRTRPGR